MLPLGDHGERGSARWIHFAAKALGRLVEPYPACGDMSVVFAEGSIQQPFGWLRNLKQMPRVAILAVKRLDIP